MSAETLEERAGNLASRVLKSGVETKLNIVGGVGTGKTTLMRAVQEALRSEPNLVPIWVSPPAEAMDSGGAALIQIGEGLHRANLFNGQLDHLRDPALLWGDKLNETTLWVDKNYERVVLICDEPDRWPINENTNALFSIYSNRHTRQISEWVQTGAKCRRLISKRWAKLGERSQYLLPQSDLPVRTLPFGTLTDVAAAFAQLIGSRSSRINFLEMKLLVALAAVTTVENAAECQTTWPDCWTLAPLLLSACEKEDRWRALRELCAKLALVRGTMTNDLLERLGVNQLESLSRDVLLYAVLQPDGNTYRLHPELKNTLTAADVLTREARIGAHRQITDYYVACLKSCDGIAGNPLECEFEGFHHSASSGSISTPKVLHAFFVDQLHTLGRTLSKEYRDYIGAAAVFQKAVEYDTNDDYAHHYWAYNIDCAAVNKRVAQDEYTRAIELNPEHPWWWSRWINFLITTGRLPEAKQQWARAIDALGAGARHGPPHVYEALHLWVARLLLHRSQLEFGQQVLDGTPESVRNKHTGFRALDRLLTAMKIARMGRGVFPANIAPADYWREEPHLDFPADVEGKPRMQWNPARVDEVDEQFVYLVAGKWDAQTGKAVYGQIELPIKRFNDASLDQKVEDILPGRLLEMAFYGVEGILRIRTYPDTPFTDPDLPFFDPPDPGRYLKKGGQLG